MSMAVIIGAAPCPHFSIPDRSGHPLRHARRGSLAPASRLWDGVYMRDRGYANFRELRTGELPRIYQPVEKVGI
jgi:hypothetical protein